MVLFWIAIGFVGALVLHEVQPTLFKSLAWTVRSLMGRKKP